MCSSIDCVPESLWQPSASIAVSLFVQSCTCMCVCTCMCMCMCVCVCVYVGLCVCVCMACVCAVFAIRESAEELEGLLGSTSKQTHG